MKKDIHPTNYRLCAFKDMSNEEVFITKSCANTKDEIEMHEVSCRILVMIKTHTECDGLDSKKFKTERDCCDAQIDILIPKRYQNALHIVLKSGDIAGFTYKLNIYCQRINF